MSALAIICLVRAQPLVVSQPMTLPGALDWALAELLGRTEDVGKGKRAVSGSIRTGGQRWFEHECGRKSANAPARGRRLQLL